MSLDLDPLHKFSNPELNRPADAAEIEQLVTAIDDSLADHSSPDVSEVQVSSFSGEVGNLQVSVQSKWVLDHMGDRRSTQLIGSVVSRNPHFADQAIRIETDNNGSPGEIEVRVGKDWLHSAGSQVIGYQVLSLLQTAVEADGEEDGIVHILDSSEYVNAERTALMPFGQDLPGLSSSQAKEVANITGGMMFDIDGARNAVIQRYFKRRILDDDATIEISNPQFVVRKDGVDAVRSFHALDITRSREPYYYEHTTQLIVAGRERVYPARTKSVPIHDDAIYHYRGGFSSFMEREAVPVELALREVRRGDIQEFTQLLQAS